MGRVQPSRPSILGPATFPFGRDCVTLINADGLPIGNLGQEAVHLSMDMNHPKQTQVGYHTIDLAVNQGLLKAVHGCTEPQLLSFESRHAVQSQYGLPLQQTLIVWHTFVRPAPQG